MISMMNRMNINDKSQRYNETPQHPLERLEPLRKNALLRKKTFDTWPETSTIKPEELCNDGFYYTGMRDKVQCVYCGGVLSGWRPNDDVHQEHAKHFSRCPSLDMADDLEEDGVPDVSDFANLCIVENVADGCNQPYNFGNQNERADLVTPTSNVPKFYNTKYSLYTQRLESFKDWPTDHELKPDALATAGLYYKGEADKCQCYVCGGILAEWESGDVPKDEHKKWFPNCPNNV